MTTLTNILNVAATNSVDLSGCSLDIVMGVLKSRLGDNPYDKAETPFKKPEQEALDFYLANHVVGLIRTKKGGSKPLSENEVELVKDYVARLDDMALRSVAYLVLICSREMRHVTYHSISKCKIPKKDVAAYHALIAFVKNTYGGNIANKLWNGDVAIEIGAWVRCMEKVFRYAGWPGGYGGTKWADVTLCLQEYIHGVYTAEMMIDVIWTLCHNGGPIFNKGMLYQHHTPELLRVLDVQRAGQVPQFDWGMGTTSWFDKYLVTARKCFPELSSPADVELIKSTAVHNALWGSAKFKTAGVTSFKPDVGKAKTIMTKKVKVKRDD